MESSFVSSQVGTLATDWAAKMSDSDVVSQSTEMNMKSEYEINPDHLRVLSVIGCGAFSIVEKAVYKTDGGDLPVAVKRLKPHILKDERGVEDCLREISILKALKAEGIVRYYGTVIDTGNDDRDKKGVYLVQELLEGGSLRQLVTRQMLTREAIYTQSDALRWCTQVARGLRHMHSSTPAVIHRDLKLDNILLTGGAPATMDAKICDFGLSILVDPSCGPTRGIPLNNWSRSSASQSGIHRASISGSYVMSGQTGSLMYMAPEVFTNQPYNHKADVFSFGVVMYEVFYKYVTFCQVSRMGTAEELERYASRVASGHRPALRKGEFPLALNSLIACCWSHDPKDRPDMADVVAQLELLATSGDVTSRDEEAALKVSSFCFGCSFFSKRAK